MRVRYEIRCGGRLLKVFDQIEITTMGERARGEESWVDGNHWWKVDEQEVATDVARAMLDKAGEQP